MNTYEKAYKEALEKAKKLYEQGTITESLSYVFPELAVSEDERISREITEFILTHRIDEPNDIEDTNSWLAWLEKQAPKPKWTEEDEELLQHCCGAVAAADYYTLEDKEEMENWLKSLKQRMEEQQ